MLPKAISALFQAMIFHHYHKLRNGLQTGLLFVNKLTDNGLISGSKAEHFLPLSCLNKGFNLILHYS